MDEVARARAASRDAVEDVTPAGLHDVIDQRFEGSRVVPGVLTRLSAKAADRSYDESELDRRVAGVQLIYDGLALTRTLARNPPWPEAENAESADMDILAADVLVGRGFHLLARTEAAPIAVETIRRFGRVETERAVAPREGCENDLEADVFELAIVAGVTATGRQSPTEARAFARDLAGSFDRETPAGEISHDRTIEAISDLVTDQNNTSPSADLVWAGSKSDT